MKKKIALVLVVLLMALLPVSAFASQIYTEGTLYYTIENDSITIVGCFGKDNTVEVPSMIAGVPVNTIGSGAFSDNPYVKTVILPDTITSIEEDAFTADITVLLKQAEDDTTTSPTPTPEVTATPEPTATAESSPTPTPTATATPTPTADSGSDNMIVLQSGDSAADSTNGAAVNAVDEATVTLEEEDEIVPENDIVPPSTIAAGPETEAESEEPVAASEQNSALPVILLVAALVLVGAGAAVVVVLKKRKMR